MRIFRRLPFHHRKTFVYAPTSNNLKICALFFLIILLYDNSNIRIIMFFLLFHFPLLCCCKDRECRTRGFCICGPAVPADDSLRTQEIIDGPLGVTRFATAQYISLCHCEPVLSLAWQSPGTMNRTVRKEIHGTGRLPRRGVAPPRNDTVFLLL